MGWRQSAVVTNLVILFGTNEGLFEYNGIPGPGNPPITWAAAPTVTADPFGNPLAVSGGLAVAKYAGSTPQELVWLDPNTGALKLGAGGPTASYSLALVEVFNSAPDTLFIESPKDLASAPFPVQLQMIAGATAAKAQFLFSQGGASSVTSGLAEVQAKGQVLSLNGGTAGTAVAWLAPSGDMSGATDAALVTGLYTLGVPTVILLPGTFYVNATVTLGLGQYLRGSGRSATIVKFVPLAAGTAITVVNSGAYAQRTFAGCHDFTIDLTGAPDGCTGLQFGDIVNLEFNLAIVDNNGAHTATTGVLGLNQLYQTEQTRAKFLIAGAGIASAIIFSKTGGGTVSFDRGNYDIWLNTTIPGGGSGILWENGAEQTGGSLNVQANLGGAAGSKGYLFSLGPSSGLTQVRLDVAAEYDGTGVAPGTWFFNSSHVRGYGVQNYASMGTSNLTISTGQHFFEGPIQGDTSLSSTIFLGSTALGQTITANGQTIFGCNSAASVIRVTSGAAFTGLILQPGVFDGQALWLVNVGGFSLTFAAAVTSNVALGVASVLASNTSTSLIWCAPENLWYPT
jgi:hypothetical protein